MDNDQVIARLGPRTRAVFLTHVLGYNALSRRLLDALARARHPADRGRLRVARRDLRRPEARQLRPRFELLLLLRPPHEHDRGRHGLAPTDPELYARAAHAPLPRHGARVGSRGAEATLRRSAPRPDAGLHLRLPGFNVRSTEINAVIGRSQLRRLDANNERRRENLRVFLAHLDPANYFTEFATEGSCNYAFTLVLRQPDDAAARPRGRGAPRARHRVPARHLGRRQPAPPALPAGPGRTREALQRFPRVDHVHFYGFYIGNYPELEQARILELCDVLNALPKRSLGARWTMGPTSISCS